MRGSLALALALSLAPAAVAAECVFKPIMTDEEKAACRNPRPPAPPPPETVQPPALILPMTVAPADKAVPSPSDVQRKQQLQQALDEANNPAWTRGQGAPDDGTKRIRNLDTTTEGGVTVVRGIASDDSAIAAYMKSIEASGTGSPVLTSVNAAGEFVIRIRPR